MSDLTLAERIAAMIKAEEPAKPEQRPISYTYKGAAKATGLGISTLQREVRAGRLHIKRVRGRVLFTDEELRRFLAEQSD